MKKLLCLLFLTFAMNLCQSQEILTYNHFYHGLVSDDEDTVFNNTQHQELQIIVDPCTNTFYIFNNAVVFKYQIIPSSFKRNEKGYFATFRTIMNGKKYDIIYDNYGFSISGTGADKSYTLYTIN